MVGGVAFPTNRDHERYRQSFLNLEAFFVMVGGIQPSLDTGQNLIRLTEILFILIYLIIFNIIIQMFVAFSNMIANIYLYIHNRQMRQSDLYCF